MNKDIINKNGVKFFVLMRVERIEARAIALLNENGFKYLAQDHLYKSIKTQPSIIKDSQAEDK